MKRRKVKRRKSRRSARRKSTLKNVNVKRISLLVIAIGIVLFFLYSLVLLSGVSARDILSENMSSKQFLSRGRGDLEKTIFVFENETGAQRGITDVYVLLHNQRKENAIVIYIPGMLYFGGLEEDFGSPIPISSLRYAGDFLQEGRGVDYALWQLNKILGFKADNYVWVTTEAYEIINAVYGDVGDVKDRFKEDYILQRGDSLTNSFLRLHTMSAQYSFLKNIFNISDIKEMDGLIYSNLSFLSAMGEIASYRRIVGNTSTLVMDLSSPRYSTEEFVDQGGSIRTLNMSDYDSTLRRNYMDIMDRGLERERVRIEVYNGSGSPGMAGMYARRILNNGCDVVRFGNAPESFERTKVYISNEREFQNSFNIVREVLFNRFERLEERPSFMTTGDIVILLGEDILQLEMF